MFRDVLVPKGTGNSRGRGTNRNSRVFIKSVCYRIGWPMCALTGTHYRDRITVSRSCDLYGYSSSCKPSILRWSWLIKTLCESTVRCCKMNSPESQFWLDEPHLKLFCIWNTLKKKIMNVILWPAVVLEISDSSPSMKSRGCVCVLVVWGPGWAVSSNVD